MHFTDLQTLKLLSKGIFSVNKIKDVTSVYVLEKLKGIILNDVKPKCIPSPLKIGHGGTLDQTATGVLVVGIGEGCKILPKLLHGSKEYEVTGQFGTATDTYNETGHVTQQANFDHITPDLLEEILQSFVGNILQTPPRYSALKRHGVRMADLTRAGVSLIMRPRPVTCHYAECCHFSLPHFKLRVSCGGGFYIRSLVHDIGLALKSCAHVTGLHRVKHGPFGEEESLEPEDWTGPNILEAIENARLTHMDYIKLQRRDKAKGQW